MKLKVYTTTKELNALMKARGDTVAIVEEETAGIIWDWDEFKELVDSFGDVDHTMHLFSDQCVATGHVKSTKGEAA